MDTLWQIQLFGTLSARRGEQIITRFATSRSAALLARLALFPKRTHPREELIDLLWPGSGLDAGRLSLRVALASLRRQLEPPDLPPSSILIADRSQIRLQPLACRCDAVEFEAALKAAARASDPPKKREFLEQALKLYAGELLPGFYDEWVIEERARLQALYLDACDEHQRLPTTAQPPAIDVSAQEENSPPLPDLRGFPIRFTRFFGREAECTRLGEWLRLPETRLVTLTGLGGAGKTRLAAEAVQQAARHFSGPICFAALADLTEAALIPDAICGVLGLTRAPHQTPFEQIVAALSNQPPALLVLDNFEQLVERGAPLLFSLLSRLPTLTCIVTSRRRLALPGEREFVVPPLALPEEGGTLEQIAQTDSTQLFLDRAQAARPDFQLTAGNAAAVAGLCRTLEGIPLAIELVAARAMALTPAQMLERLGERFTLLTTRRGDKGTRHRSLWAAIAWSYDLLSPPLQRFFARLSVFRGGFTPEAAQMVCEEEQALEFLTQLRERSLIVPEESRSGIRFRLLESLREFAAEHLASDERQTLAGSHAAYFLMFAESAEPHLVQPDQALWLDSLEADHDNLRLALAFWLADASAVEEGLKLSGVLWRFWAVRGHYVSGRDWQARALARPGGSAAARAKTVNGAGNLARAQGDYAAAEALFAEALILLKATGHQVGIGSCLCNQGMVAMHQAKYEEARELYRHSLELRRQIGDQRGEAFSLECLGMVAHHVKDFPEARRRHEESLAIWSALNDDGGRMLTLANLAAVTFEEGDYAASEKLHGEALRLCLDLQDLSGLACVLGNFGMLFYRMEQRTRAVALFAASEALRRRIGSQLAPQDDAEFEAALTAARSDLDSAEFEAAWAQGLAMTGDQAAAYALK